jgi:hypothetical protein
VGFVRVFAILLGLTCLAYGVLVIIFGLDGFGPCRVSCEFNRAIYGLVGQGAYNIIYGGFWVASSLIFLWYILFKLKATGNQKGKKR